MRPDAARQPRSRFRRPSSIATLLLFVLFALAAAGCGDDSSSPDDLPPAPKLTIPNGTVESDADSDSGASDATGATGDSSSGTDTTTDSGGTTTTTPQQNTGGQGTPDTQTTPDAGQDTGGAAPGN
ncbi:MAG: hypothetical protein WAP35_01255 [Solirubrobacterales bacterium]